MSDYRLLTLRSAAHEMGVRWETVRALVETGQLRAVKVGTRYLIPASALLELGAPQDGPAADAVYPTERPPSPRPLRALRG